MANIMIIITILMHNLLNITISSLKNYSDGGGRVRAGGSKLVRFGRGGRDKEKR